jgi:hypothetical protein
MPLDDLITLADNWDNFERTDISQSAPPAQLTEMHRAFYSGAASAAMLIARGKTNAIMLDALTKIHGELATYINAQRAARRRT